ncbi:carboxymuconolactone decarboxylase family protein [Salinisphaera sp. SPP-AMP-43]|uniref:carboxymuconolactone decarboxylase family protein n=1 Tax=Salinisphaera sp. SPP-AMP-43 TaxID=3121288 RepID=UPI003C6DF1B7
MSDRINLFSQKNGGIDGLIATEKWLAEKIDSKLIELVKVRVSQLNGCAYCLHMHRQAALELGETEDRLLLLSAWRESRLYSAQERAALAWAETLTLIAETHAPDEAYDAVNRFFTNEELIALSIGIAIINAWNRLAIGFRLQHKADRKQTV